MTLDIDDGYGKADVSPATKLLHDLVVTASERIVRGYDLLRRDEEVRSDLANAILFDYIAFDPYFRELG